MFLFATSGNFIIALIPAGLFFFTYLTLIISHFQTLRTSKTVFQEVDNWVEKLSLLLTSSILVKKMRMTLVSIFVLLLIGSYNFNRY